jgi:hypothetical protein
MSPRKARKPRPITPLYKTWCREHEAEDDAREYGALGIEESAQLHAAYYFGHCNGWECKWPLTFEVVDPTTGEHHIVRVELETEPVFVTGKALPVKMPPAIHALWGGAAMCDDPRLADVPAKWPEGQTWTSLSDLRADAAKLEALTCTRCQTFARRQVDALKHIGVADAKPA